MKSYENILLGVELNPECDELPIKQTLDMAKEFNAQINLVHAIEHMSSYGAAYGVAAGADIEEMLVENAKKEMATLGKKLGIPADQQTVKVGPAKAVILEKAEELASDLIIVGSHGRHGIRLLLGATANAVIHGAKCDVLAVRVRE